MHDESVEPELVELERDRRSFVRSAAGVAAAGTDDDRPAQRLRFVQQIGFEIRLEVVGRIPGVRAFRMVPEFDGFHFLHPLISLRPGFRATARPSGA